MKGQKLAKWPMPGVNLWQLFHEPYILRVSSGKEATSTALFSKKETYPESARFHGNPSSCKASISFLVPRLRFNPA